MKGYRGSKSIDVRRRPPRIFRAHVDFVEVLVEPSVVFAILLHHIAGNPLSELKHGELVAQPALAVTVHNVRERARREDFIDGMAVQLFTGFCARVEMRDAEADAVRVARLEVIAALHDRRAGADHIVEDDHVLAFQIIQADFALVAERDAHGAFAAADLAHDDAFALRELERVPDGVHERGRALVRGDDDEVVAVLARLDEVGILDVVRIDVRRNQVVEVTFENIGEELLHLDAVVVDGDNRVHAGSLEELRVKKGSERLAVKLAEVGNVTVLLKFAEAVRTAVLGTVKEIGFDEDHAVCAIVLRRTGEDAGAHREVIAAAFVSGYGAEEHDLAVETLADVLLVVNIEHVTGAEFRIGERFERHRIGNIVPEPDILCNVNGERIVGKCSSHYESV